MLFGERFRSKPCPGALLSAWGSPRAPDQSPPWRARAAVMPSVCRGASPPVPPPAGAASALQPGALTHSLNVLQAGVVAGGSTEARRLVPHRRPDRQRPRGGVLSMRAGDARQLACHTPLALLPLGRGPATCCACCLMLCPAVPNRLMQWIIQEVKASGLRGRGGAGFSTGMKW